MLFVRNKFILFLRIYFSFKRRFFNYNIYYILNRVVVKERRVGMVFLGVRIDFFKIIICLL